MELTDDQKRTALNGGLPELLIATVWLWSGLGLLGVEGLGL